MYYFLGFLEISSKFKVQTLAPDKILYLQKEQLTVNLIFKLKFLMPIKINCINILRKKKPSKIKKFQ